MGNGRSGRLGAGLGLALTALAASSADAGPSVAFINPGKQDEPFWQDAALAMQQAATSLGIELEMLFAERDYLAQISLTREVAERSRQLQPDYLVLVGDKRTLFEQLELAEGAKIQSFVAYNTVQSDERVVLGYPRERYASWLGSLVPRAEDAGYLTAKALVEKARSQGLSNPEGIIEVLAISGDRATDSSNRRNHGMQAALDEHPDVQLRQLVHGDWRKDKAAEQARQLYLRYPEARVLWAGSDLMAFGAIDSLRQAGGVPGQDMLFSAINTSEEAMQALISGELAALAGGHYLTGAWALVLLYDHYHGLDFAATEGTELERPMFMSFDPDSARQFIERQNRGGVAVDYCHFSKVCNPTREDYDFSLKGWLEAPLHGQ